LLPETSQYDRVITSALRNAIKDRGLNPHIYDAFSFPESAEGLRSRKDLEDDLRQNHFNGLVLLDGQKPEHIRGYSKDIPCVMYGSPKPPIDVHIDYYHFASNATRWLIEGGCRKLAYFYNPILGTPAYDGHLRGFREQMAAAGLLVSRHGMVDLSQFASVEPIGPATADRSAYDGTLQVLQQWHKEKFFPDGILISDDIMARGIAVAIQSSPKFRDSLPRIAVLATEGAEHFYAVPMMRYAISSEEIAQKLLARLYSKIVNEQLSPEPDLVRGKIIESFR